MSEEAHRSVGQYQVIEFVARGDSAFVYKGFQPAVNRYVAIKMLSPSMARDAEAKRRFQHQAEIMAQLEHPGILAVYDFGLERNMPYLISHFAEGGTLKSRLAQFQTPNRALNLLSAVVPALEYLHDQGVIHGNLKSTNILFDSQDRPLLTDIGMDQTDMFGQVNLSPEGAQGGPVDRRSDVYSLGVLLYELMVGQPPQVGISPHPRQARPDLPASIESVILTAMAQYPEERYQSAGEFQEALALAMETEDAQSSPELEEESVTPEPLVYPLPESASEQDNRWILMAICGFILVVIFWVAVAAIGYTLVRNEEKPPASAVSIPMGTANYSQSVYSGPGTNYSVEGVMMAGQTAQIIGVSADGGWWSILFPRGQSGIGWVAADLVTVENGEGVPVIEPPVTPMAALSTLSI
ncbi:MAG TPA: serine/threonine protein kinase [Patescibacteria group bacterium]|nr:serine/threonine protein kinase [Patescibacteria group bacterium]